MNKQYISNVVTLIKKIQENNEDADKLKKDLLQNLVKATISIEETDLKDAEAIALCTDQYTYTHDVLSTLTPKELQEFIPIEAIEGSQDYKLSMGCLKLLGETIGEDREYLNLYHNNDIQGLYDTYNRIDAALGCIALVEYVNLVNQQQIANTPHLPEQEMLDWYDNVRIAYQLLLKINVDDIVTLFPANDNSFNTRQITKLFKGKTLENNKNLDDFLANYGNADLQEFALRLWFVQDVAEKYQQANKSIL